jgi:hypothetical protein
MSPLIALNNGQFSYEDAGGPGVPMLALHGSFGRRRFSRRWPKRCGRNTG